ncbi:MAG: hypothetical protein KIT69_17600, partial [Propionibacteriaceae bacterium]|nr:hypothetical protein [Propionibacteriaceae bacterium]
RGLILTQAAIARNLAAAAEEASTSPAPPATGAPSPPTTIPGDVPALNRSSGRLEDAWAAAQTTASAAREALAEARAAAEAAAKSAEQVEAQAQEALAESQSASTTAQPEARSRETSALEAQTLAVAVRNHANLAAEAASSARRHAEAARARAERSMDSRRAAAAWRNARSADRQRTPAVSHSKEAAKQQEEAATSARKARRLADRAKYGALPSWITEEAQLFRLLKEQERQLGKTLAKPPDDIGAGIDDRVRYVRTVIELKALDVVRSLRAEESLDEKLDKHEVILQSVPSLAYSYACYLVRWKNIPFDDQRVTKLFDTALTLDVLAEFVADDPELWTAGDEAGFKKLLARATAQRH